MTSLQARLRDRFVAKTTISTGLREEIERGGWMYEWRLTPTVATPLLGPNLPSVHTTREEMIEPVVRRALAAAGENASALDLACNEGWFSHRLLDWGADRVVGIDVREDNIRRAGLIRDHFGIPERRLSFHAGDVLELDAEALGRFDVVLLLGLIYHLERPLDAVRLARRVTRTVCVIESQLTRQNRPIIRGDGVPNVYHQSAASFAAWVEDEPDNPLSSLGGVMSLVPNRAALEAMPRWAGFDHVEFLSPRPEHDLQYVVGDRAIVAASVSAEQTADSPKRALQQAPRG
jgi:tRNA (mo5U34)-methyltransferase